MSEQRYYYKTQNNKGFLSLKHELTEYEIQQHGYVRITYEEFCELTNPVEEETEGE